MKLSRILVLLRGDFPLLFVALPFIAGQQCASLVADNVLVAAQAITFLVLFSVGRVGGELCRVVYFFVGGCLAAMLLTQLYLRVTNFVVLLMF
jgi:hypothetical protein